MFLFLSGPTELDIFQNLEEIAELALPPDKLKKACSDVNTTKNFALHRFSFCQACIDVSELSSYYSVFFYLFIFYAFL